MSTLDSDYARIYCGIEVGHADTLQRLCVIEAREIDPRAPAGHWLAAIENNGGPCVIDVVGDYGADGGPYGCSIQAACDVLGMSATELRAAIEIAYPPASDWDWAVRR